MSSGIASIRVHQVTRLFGATAALRGITCRFQPGSITFVQGPNGAGKSTLMSIISTTLRPTSGYVAYDPFQTDRREARSRIGWVGHDSHCYPDLTGRENVQFAAQLHGLTDSRTVDHAAARVQAERFFDQPVRTLSRGQRQRVALARALVHEPSVLLLDEPLSGLDAASSDRFVEIIKEEQARDRIIIIVSHRDAWIAQFDSLSLRLERGRLVESSTPGVPPATP